MLRSRLLWRVYAGFGALILVSAAVVGFLMVRRMEADALRDLERSLRARSALLRSLVLRFAGDPSDAPLRSQIRDLGSETGTRITLIRADGEVWADSERDPSAIEASANRPEILEARAKGVGSAIRFSSEAGSRMMHLARPVESGGELIGFVEVSLPLAALDERIRHLWISIAFGALASVLMALVLGRFIARGFSRPLAAMTRMAAGMADGEGVERLAALEQDEIGDLSRALNRLAESLREGVVTGATERSRLLAVMGGMVEGVLAVDSEERVVHLNAAGAEILSAAPAGAVGKRIWEICRIREVCEVVSETVGSGEEVRRQVRLVGRPRDRIIGLYASPLRDGRDDLAGAVMVMHDLTELQRLEGVRRDFVANVSHELKTPITAIRGLVETMADDREMNDATRGRFVSKILEQTKRLSAIVSDLLSLAQLESAEEKAPAAPLDLRMAVDAVARSLRPSGEQKGIAFTVELPPSPVRVSGDEEALRQATANLVDNAIKYTPAGGRVRLRLSTEGRSALIEVEDTGAGIERRHQDRIFERFYRVDKARSRELGGTGLGLSIVRHIAEVHGGTVSVASLPGRGSTFRLRIPLSSS